MPNHIKNRIELVGSPEEVKSVVDRFSTFFPTEPSKSHADNLIYKKSGADYEFGWLDESTGIFTQRDKPSVIGVPDGFEQQFDEQWTRFPDFEKVFPSPESIKAVGDSVNTSIINAVKAKYKAGVSSNPLLAFLEKSNRENAGIKPEEQGQFELACRAYEETGFAYWYDWNYDKWGTKWNAYSCEKLSDNTYTFETAWSGVPRIINEISKGFKGVINYKYADEDTGCNVGIWNFENGMGYYHEIKNNTKEAYELAFELRPDSKENYHLVGDTYEYVDDED